MHPGTGLPQYYGGVPENFQFTILPGVGHCPHDEEPDVVNANMIAWLEKMKSGVASS